MSGIDDFVGCSDYGDNHYEELSKVIDLSNGIPSHDTIGRVMSNLDVDKLYETFDDFINEIIDISKKGVIAIDGKTMRGSCDKAKNKSAFHIVSAWSDCCNLFLGQVKTHEKSNEITAIPELLDMIDIAGQIVTIDAMRCQRDICKKIVEKGGDYVISLKGNQGNLHRDIQDYFNDKELPITNEWSEIDKNYGRIEERNCKSLDDIKWLNDNHKWPYLKSISVVNAKITRNNKRN